MAETKIKLENVYKIFGPHPERGIEFVEQGMSKEKISEEYKLTVGVNNVSFEVKEGEILVVMGLSGSGKSTLVRCINRLIEPTGGKIFVSGEDITQLDENGLREMRLKHFGMVFQNFALFPHRTVSQNVGYGLEIQGVEVEERKRRSQEALEQVGLKGWGDSYPAQLSGGMQQRVGLARALALNSDIMLMDEAFSALDPLIRRDMQDELLELQSRMQKTIVFISHDLDEALKIGDRIVLMKDGYVVQEGTAEEILTKPADDYVAKFVEDVDMSKVLTAATVMKHSEALANWRTDGPRAALRKMRKAGISSIFVVEDSNHLVGVVMAEEAAKAVENGEKTLESILIRDIKTVSPDVAANDLFAELSEIPYPLAVVDEEKRLRGVIVRGTILAALSDRGVVA
ncbi:MAG: quaternary amine ABC transporter ATP-binding protein [Thermodesulfobacteriota bacterium]